MVEVEGEQANQWTNEVGLASNKSQAGGWPSDRKERQRLDRDRMRYKIGSYLDRHSQDARNKNGPKRAGERVDLEGM